MSNSNHEISAEGRLIDEGGAYSVRSRQVTVLKNGAVQITYQSFDDYLRDLEFHRSDKDLLSELPNEILSKIVKNIIPSGERIAIGVDYFGTNQTHIPCGSLNILCVSKSISVIALHVLYGCRSYELVAETNLHSNKEEQGWISHYNIEESRYQRLREAINSLHPATTPTDCLSLLVRHTPAQLYMTNLKIKINKPTAASLGNGELLKILKQAKGLLVLELELQVDLPGIMGFVYQLRHVREIKLLSGLGQTECYEREMALRNKNWVQPGEEVENTGGMTPEPGWVVLKVVCRR